MMDYFKIPASELGKDSKIPVYPLGDSGEVFYELALEMVNTIKENNAEGRKTVFICPVGPVGQYPIFVRLVNRERISLKNCWFINMDEYLNDDETWIDIESPLSFRGFMRNTVYTKVDPELLMPEEQRVFPDPSDPGKVDRLIEGAWRRRHRLRGNRHQRPPRVQRGSAGAQPRGVCAARAPAC